MLGPMARDFSISIDGQNYDGHYNTVSVHNMELWGGDLQVAPGAAFDDGLLDVIRWGDLGRRKVMAAVQGQRNGGTHLDMEGIDRHPAKVVQLASPKMSRLDLDGEKGGYLPARITVVAGALRVLAP
jgi:diacylglycerol kinase (ATP)